MTWVYAGHRVGCEVKAGYTARKFLTKQGVTNILPITATLGRLNEAHTVESAVLSAGQMKYDQC